MAKNKYIPSFGVEIHAELLTKTKAFSPVEREWNAPPNTNIDEVVLGYPGAKPQVNFKMIELAYLAARSFKMEIEEIIKFDRKNYYYPDLAKNYQITQHFNPLGKNGGLVIVREDGSKKFIKITEMHIEEDTAKQIVEEKIIKFDYNRSGNPLIEIVTDHRDFKNIEDVALFVEQLREQLKLNKINSGILAEGAFRIDINISLRAENAKEFGSKVEIKNLNSIRNLRSALEYEIKLQSATLEQGRKIISSTKRFNEKTQQTDIMREKFEQKNYNFIREANILPIKLTQETLKSFNKEEVYIVSNIRSELLSKKVPSSQIKALLSYPDLFLLWKELKDDSNSNNLIAFFTSSFLEIYKTTNNDLNKINKEQLLLIIKFFYEKKISNTYLKELLTKLNNYQDLTEEIKQLKLIKFYDQEELNQALKTLIEDNKETLLKNQDRIGRNQNFLMGQLIKKHPGKINPETANVVIKEMLKTL